MQFKPTIADLDFFGMTLQLRACEGIVQEIREHTHSELETTQTHRGHLSNVELVTDRVQNVWLRLADDSEAHVSVGGVSLPMRAGHRLRAYYAACSPGERGTLVAVKNFTTGEVVDTINRFQPLPSPGWRHLSIMRQLGAGLAVALVFVAAFLGAALLRVVGVPFVVGVWGVGIATLVWLLVQNARFVKRIQAFQKATIQAVHADQ